MNYVTVDYPNEIIDRCTKVCPSAGPMSCKYLRNILRTAYLFGYVTTAIYDMIKSVKLC